MQSGRQKSFKLIWPSLLVLIFLVPFQNCNKVQMSSVDEKTVDANGTQSQQSSQTDSPNGPIDMPADPNDRGVMGGHFDLDTSSRVYTANNGDTDHHEHEYDDEYNQNYVDFFNLRNNRFTKISDRVSATQEFIVIVANAQLSPGTILEINGQAISGPDYQKKVADYFAGQSSALQTFTLASLRDLKLKFSKNDLRANILVPTQTKCVVDNKLTAGGLYRNGAFLVQILDKNSAKLSASTKSADLNGGLLWEASVFWHKEGTPCL